MEYIEKKGNTFYARTGEVEIDKVSAFDSKANYVGWGGSHVSIEVNDFVIEWYSNFKFGSWAIGAAYVNFKGIYIKSYYDLMTTQAFVDILNAYSSFTEKGKDLLIIDLANRLAHFRELSRFNKIGDAGNNNPEFLKPIIDINECMVGGDLLSYNKLKKN